GREIVERDILALGDHQDMHRRRGLDVMEGEDVLILMHLAAGDLAAQDAGEDIVAIVSHAALRQLAGRDFFSSMPEAPARFSSARQTCAGATPAPAHSTSR